jgi:hypothetical protein
MTTMLLALLVSLSVAASGQHQHPASHDRANQGMGFDQEKTTHHFLLEQTGGVIEVTAKEPTDAASVDQIRMHLRHIASAFASGDFSLPMFIHDTDPPGVATMKERRTQITFRYEDVTAGGKVVVVTADSGARAALHDFLRYQIREHKTGDPLTPR